MADLVTHLCTGLWVGLPFGRGRMALAGLGAVLPDLAGRVPGLVLDRLGVEPPDAILHVLMTGHVPVGSLLWCVAVAQAFEDRWLALRWLAVGTGLHYALDVLQDHHGVGYHLGVPLWYGRFELGWMGSEATTGWAPWLLAATALTVAFVEWQRATNTDEADG